MTLIEHRSLLAPAGKAKMRAKALLAEGDPAERFEAAVLLHDAARAELRALDALEDPAIETRLAARVEACGCLLLGLDVLSAIPVWRDVEHLALGLAPEVSRAMLARLTAQYRKEWRSFQGLWQKSPTLARARTFRPSLTGHPTRARRELAALLERFPGSAQLWVGRCVDRDFQGESTAAWDDLTRARRLEPEAPMIEALALWLLPRAFDAAEARRRLDAHRAGLDRAPPELCLGYALAELVLSEGALDERARLDHAREVAALGQSRMVLGGRIGSPAQSVDGVSLVLSLHLAAIEQIARERIAGHSPGLDLLYRVGLGRFAADAHARGLEDPVDVLRGGTPRALEGPHPIAPIAA
ncbi:MAG: hypothetical protein U0324_10590 [Polyangiales bacterium]